MLRIVLGWLLILHALAHAGVGTWSSASGTMWPSTVLWTTAYVAYTIAGLGLLRVPELRRRWKPWIVVATCASILTLAWHPSVLSLLGVAVDVALLIVVLSVMRLRIDVDIAVVRFLGSAAFRHPRWVRAGWTLGCVWLAYGSVVGASTTRIIAQTRGPGDPGAVAFLRAPLDVFVLEAAHLIVGSGILRGARDRADRATRHVSAAGE